MTSHTVRFPYHYHCALRSLIYKQNVVMPSHTIPFPHYDHCALRFSIDKQDLVMTSHTVHFPYRYYCTLRFSIYRQNIVTPSHQIPFPYHDHCALRFSIYRQNIVTPSHQIPFPYHDHCVLRFSIYKHNIVMTSDTIPFPYHCALPFSIYRQNLSPLGWCTSRELWAGSNLNIKMVFPKNGDFHYKDRQLQDHLIFILGIPMLVRHLYIEMALRLHYQHLLDSSDLFSPILQGYFQGTGAILWLHMKSATFPLAWPHCNSSQWEMSLQSNVIFHWLGANLESALVYDACDIFDGSVQDCSNSRS